MPGNRWKPYEVSLEYRVKILPDALEDAKSLYQWIKQESPMYATQWFNGLFDAIDELAFMPLRYARAPESNILDLPIHHYVYKRNYRILFMVDGDIVRIYRIRHTSQRLVEDSKL